MGLNKDFEVFVTTSVGNFAVAGIKFLTGEFDTIVTPNSDGSGETVFDLILDAQGGRDIFELTHDGTGAFANFGQGKSAMFDYLGSHGFGGGRSGSCLGGDLTQDNSTFGGRRS